MPRIRLRLTRDITLAGLSHRAYGDLVREALAQSGLPTARASSQPSRPRITLGPPLPEGYTSFCEFVDVELPPAGTCPPISAAAFAHTLAHALPKGIGLRWARRVPDRAGHLGAMTGGFWYTIGGEFEPAAAARFAQSTAWPFVRMRKGRERVLDLKKSVPRLVITTEGVELNIEVHPEGTPKPAEVLQSIFGVPCENAAMWPGERRAVRLALPPYPRASALRECGEILAPPWSTYERVRH